MDLPQPRDAATRKADTLAKLAQSSMDEIAEFLSNSKSIQTADASDEETPVALQ